MRSTLDTSATPEIQVFREYQGICREVQPDELNVQVSLCSEQQGGGQEDERKRRPGDEMETQVR